MVALFTTVFLLHYTACAAFRLLVIFSHVSVVFVAPGQFEFSICLLKSVDVF